PRAPLGRWAAQGLDCHAGLGRRLVRQAGFAGDVADGLDVRHVRPPLFVHGNEAALVLLYAGLLQAEVREVRPPTHRHQYAVEFLGSAAFELGPGHLGHDAARLRGKSLDLGSREDRLELLAKLLFQGNDEVPVDWGKNGIERFDHGDLGAEGGVNAADFQADVAAADNEHLLRNVRQEERRGAIHDAVVADLPRFRDRGNRTGRDDAVLEANALTAGYSHSVGIGKSSVSLDDLDAASLGELADAARQFADHFLLHVIAELFQIDFRRFKGE